MSVALGFLGVAATAAAAFGGNPVGVDEAPVAVRARAPEGASPDGAREGRPARCGARADRGRGEGRGDDRRHGRHPGRRLVHGEMKVQAREGFATIVTDAGEIVGLDDESRTVEIRRADGETASATAGETTRLCRDGHPVEFAAFGVGDLARIVTVTHDGETMVRGIRARTQDDGETS